MNKVLPLTVVIPAKVETPATLKLSKFVWPSTSKSAFRSILLRNVDIPPWTPTSKFLSTVKSLNENVDIPEVGAPVCPIYLYPTMYMFVSVTPLVTFVSLKFRTPAE